MDVNTATATTTTPRDKRQDDDVLTLGVVPAPDAAFTIQAINEQYNSFYRAAATSLFYVRTGVNLGFGAPPVEDARDIDPLRVHKVPNHYVQECLANWLEFYVGRYLMGTRVTGEGLPPAAAKGDFSNLRNSPETYPPLSALMNFLEDWYACACVQFVRGDLSADDRRRLHRFLAPFNDAILRFIAPAGDATAAYDRAGEVSVAMRVQILNDIFEAEFPPRGRAFCPQVVLMTAAPGAEARTHACLTAVAQGPGLVPLPPDLHAYTWDAGSAPADAPTFSYPLVVRLREASFDLEDAFQPDRIFLLEATYANGDAVEHAYDCLFGLIGQAPSFAHRGYMRRVTERVLRENLPAMSDAHVRGIVHHLYPGDRVVQPAMAVGGLGHGMVANDGGVGSGGDGGLGGVGSDPVGGGDELGGLEQGLPRVVTLAPSGAASGVEKAHIVLSFTASAWTDAGDAVETLLAFLHRFRVVTEDGRDVYVATRKKSKWRAVLRLHPKAGLRPDTYACEESSHVLAGRVEDLSRAPLLALFLSGANAASLALRGDKSVARAHRALVRRSLSDHELNRVFGAPALFGTVMDHRSRVDLRGEGLESPCVTYALFREGDWFDSAEDVAVVDHHARYVPAVREPSGGWVLGRRATDEEDGRNVCLIAPRPVVGLGRVPTEGGMDMGSVGMYGLGDPVTDGTVVYDKADIACASSSLQKGLVFNFLHLALMQALGDAPCRRALSTLLDLSTPLRYAGPDLAERHASDVSDLRTVL